MKETSSKNFQNSSLKGLSGDVSTQDEIVPALHAMYADNRVACATGNIYAYRLKSVASVMEHYEVDDEWGAGQVMLKLLKENNM